APHPESVRRTTSIVNAGYRPHTRAASIFHRLPRTGTNHYDKDLNMPLPLGAPMLGLMQSQPLLISSLIEFVERHHGDTEVVSRRVEGDIHRYTWRDVARRARQAAHALDGMNLLFSDRVATLAWNGY